VAPGFLRVLNYGIFFAAMVAAIGIGSVAKTWPAPAIGALWAVSVLVSFFATVRPPQRPGC